MITQMRLANSDKQGIWLMPRVRAIPCPCGLVGRHQLQDSMPKAWLPACDKGPCSFELASRHSTLWKMKLCSSLDHSAMQCHLSLMLLHLQTHLSLLLLQVRVARLWFYTCRHFTCMLSRRAACWGSIWGAGPVHTPQQLRTSGCNCQGH